MLEKELKSFEHLKELLDYVFSIAKGSSVREVNDTIKTILKKTAEILNCRACGIYLYSEQKGLFSGLVYVDGEYKKYEISKDEGLCGYIYKTGEVLNIKDAYKDRRFSGNFDMISNFKTTSVVGVPIVKTDGEILGVLECFNKEPDSYFSVEDATFLKVVAVPIAMSIENARLSLELKTKSLSLAMLTNDLKAKEKEIEVIFEIATHLNQFLEIEDFVKNALRLVINTVNSDIVTVVVYENGTYRYFQMVKKGFGFSSHIFENKVPEKFRVGDINSWSTRVIGGGGASIEVYNSVLNTVEYAQYCLTILIKTRQGTAGILEIFGYKPRKKEWILKDKTFLETVASFIGNAVERNSLLLEKINNERLATVGKLTGSLFHDLKTPLNIILSCAEMIELKDKSEVVKKYAPKIKKQVSFIVEMIREILNFSKGGAEILREKVNMDEFVEEIEEVIAGLAKGLNIEFIVKNEYHNFLRFDKNKILRVITNIVKNGIEAMPEGGKLEISIFEKNGFVVFKISDSGIGISEEVKPKLFKMFESTKREGTGLGLSMAKQIIDAHRGNISFESEVGKGTTFYISLPLVR